MAVDVRWSWRHDVKEAERGCGSVAKKLGHASVWGICCRQLLPCLLEAHDFAVGHHIEIAENGEVAFDRTGFRAGSIQRKVALFPHLNLVLQRSSRLLCVD